jgi:hypothetical protein
MKTKLILLGAVALLAIGYVWTRLHPPAMECLQMLEDQCIKSRPITQ